MAAALTVWEPVWWLAGGVKDVKVAVSVAMAVAAPPLLPEVLDVANGDREAERERRERAEAAWAAGEREAARRDGPRRALLDRSRGGARRVVVARMSVGRHASR